MFSWFRKRPSPPRPSANNPGLGHTAKVAFSNGERSWQETDNLVTSLASTLTNLKHEVAARERHVELGNGIMLLPQVVSVTPKDGGAVQTVSTVQVSHPSLVPAGVFEFQHAAGADVRQSFASGFDTWAQIDLPVFLDALRAKPESSMYMVMTPGREGNSMLPRDRRVVLGPTAHFAQQPEQSSDEHPFCMCCLFTRSVDAFREQLASDAFVGIRMFAMRDADGKVQADCRVNGVDWPAGSAKLMEYAGTWPHRGFEYRKQYVAIQTMQGETGA